MFSAPLLSNSSVASHTCKNRLQDAREKHGNSPHGNSPHSLLGFCSTESKGPRKSRCSASNLERYTRLRTHCLRLSAAPLEDYAHHTWRHLEAWMKGEGAPGDRPLLREVQRRLRVDDRLKKLCLHELHDYLSSHTRKPLGPLQGSYDS